MTLFRLLTLCVILSMTSAQAFPIPNEEEPRTQCNQTYNEWKVELEEGIECLTIVENNGQLQIMISYFSDENLVHIANSGRYIWDTKEKKIRDINTGLLMEKIQE